MHKIFINKSSASLLALPRNGKRLVVIVLDLLIALFTVWFAFYLRIDQVSLPQHKQVYV